MPARGNEAPVAGAPDICVTPLAELILARIACGGGATRAEIIRELGPLTLHRLSPAEWRSSVEQGLQGLSSAGLATETRSRFHVTDGGSAHAAAWLDWGAASLEDWPEIRDAALVGKALGLSGIPATRKKTLARPEGLRTIILQKTYGLAGKKNIAPAKLRAQLALVALERAFGNKIKAGFRKGAGLPSHAARTLAGQLANPAREFATDAKLIAQLAAEAVGAMQPDADALRQAILRRFVSGLIEASPSQAASLPTTSPSTKLSPPANDRAPPSKGPPPRPGLEDFAAAVKHIGARAAEGWPGNRRAFISSIWDGLRTEKESWGLSEIEFKCMLTEAHKRGALMLANADLRNKDQRTEIERSATPDRNTVWHYVRIED